jgi:hypothetical protein
MLAGYPPALRYAFACQLNPKKGNDMKTYLRLGADTLEQAKRYASKKAAIAAYAAVARELDRYGQSIEATLHYARNADELAEYPDYHVYMTDTGVIRCRPV